MGLRQIRIGRLKQAIFPYEVRIVVLRCQRPLGFVSFCYANAITSEILLVGALTLEACIQRELDQGFQFSNTLICSLSNLSERLDSARSGRC